MVPSIVDLPKVRHFGQELLRGLITIAVAVTAWAVCFLGMIWLLGDAGTLWWLLILLAIVVGLIGAEIALKGSRARRRPKNGR